MTAALIRWTDWLGVVVIVLANRLFHLLKIITKPISGINWRGLGDTLNLNGTNTLLCHTCAFALIFVPQIKQLTPSGGADKLLNSENLWPQWCERVDVNFSRLAVNLAASIKPRLNLADDGTKSITAITPPTPPRRPHAGASSDETSKRGADNGNELSANHNRDMWISALQLPLFALGMLIFVGGFVFWDTSGRYWWRRLTTPNDRTERCGRPSASELATDAARPHSLR